MNSTSKTLFFAFIGFLLSASVAVINPLRAAPKTSVKSGNWNDPTVWDTGVPGTTDDAVIAAGDTVTLVANVTLRTLTIQANAVLEAGFYDYINNYNAADSYGLSFIAYTNNGIHNATSGNVYNTLGIGVDGSGISNCNFKNGEVFNFVNTCNLTINGDIYSVGSGGSIVNEGTLTINGDMTSSYIRNYSIIHQTGNVSAQLFKSIYVENYGTFNISGNIDMSGNGLESYFWNLGTTDIGGDVLGSGDGVSYFIQDINAIARFGGSVFPTGNEGNLLAAGISGFSGNSAEPNTIEYYGTDQAIKIPREFYDGSAWYWETGTYSNLILSNSGIKTMDSSLIINGNLTIRDAAQLDVSATPYNIDLKGSWINTSTASLTERTGTVTLRGTAAQSITASAASGGETFYNLIVNNSGTGVTLINGNVNVSDTLTLTDGLIHTGIDTVWVSNNDTASILGYSDSSYVNGYLKRGIAATPVGSYDFPVGNADAYELANVDFVGLGSIDVLTVNFSNPTGSSGLPLTDANEARYNALLNCGGTAPVTGHANEGVWNIRPASGSAIYDLTLYGLHYGNAQTYHSIVKRNSSGTPWEFAGTYLAASGVEPLVAHRTCLSGFYQFAIAGSNTSTPLITTPLSFHSDDTMFCGSKCIDFTAKSILSATKWRWTITGGVFANAADSMIQNPTNICFNTSGNYDVRLIASTACTANTSMMSQYIKVNPIPTAIITGNTGICSGENLALSASPGGSGITYLWSTMSTTETINPSPLSDMTYSVIVSTAFCSDTANAGITVTTTPTLTLTTTKDNLCSGDSAKLTGAGSGTFLWSTGITTNSIYVSTAETYSLTLSNGSCFDRDTITIYVTTQPTATITGESTICSGKRDVLSAKSSIPGVTYLWNTGTTNQGINATPLTSSIYSVVISNGICKDTATLFVTVITTPTITLTANKTIVCSGGSVTMTASDNSGRTTDTFFWNTGASTAVITTTPVTSQNFVITLSNNICANKDSILITIIPMPTASISGSTTLCLGNSTSLSASSGSTAGTTFLWNTGETTVSITKTPLSNTSYSVTVSNGNGLCIDTASRSITLINPVLTDAGPDITMAIGLDTVLSTSNGTAWEWTPKGRLNCYTCQSTIASPLQTTSYIVTVTDINGCVASDSITIFIIPCAELFIPKAFSPNNDGQNDVLYIRGTDCIEKVFSFTIFNRWGEKVFETLDIKAGWDGSQSKETIPNEVFIYYLDALSINGDAINKTGNVTLMR